MRLIRHRLHLMSELGGRMWIIARSGCRSIGEQMDQAILNVLQNAVEAVGGEGPITILHSRNGPPVENTRRGTNGGAGDRSRRTTPPRTVRVRPLRVRPAAGYSDEGAYSRRRVNGPTLDVTSTPRRLSVGACRSRASKPVCVSAALPSHLAAISQSPAPSPIGPRSFPLRPHWSPSDPLGCTSAR